MDIRKRVQLEKILCYVLRHCPEDYGIELDNDGFASIEGVCKGVGISKEELEEIVAFSKDKLFEIKGERVKAVSNYIYHKTTVKIETVPPKYLYYGIAQEERDYFEIEGIRSEKRQYVLLSVNPITARRLEKRRTEKPIIVAINAKKAFQNGIRFYEGTRNIILADPIPPEYILNRLPQSYYFSILKLLFPLFLLILLFISIKI